MRDLSRRLKRFERRVRLVRGWRGLAMGAAFGALASAVWAGLDWLNVAYTEWAWMGGLVGGGALLGAAVGLALKVPESALADSIDRRAGLDNRLATASERSEAEDPFSEAVRGDAERRLETVRPAEVFPFRVGRWHAGAAALAVVAASVFLLGNTPLLLSDETKRARSEMQAQGQVVKRVDKETFEDPKDQQGMSEEEKRLADEMRKYQRELEKARMSKEESLQKANDLAKQAEDLMRQKAQEAQKSLEQAQTAMDQLQQAALQKDGLQNVSPEMAQMSDAQREQALQQNKAQQNQLQKQLDDLRKKLDELNRKLQAKGMSKEERDRLEAERKRLEAQKKALEDELKRAQQDQHALELSQKARDVLNKLMNDPMFKKLQELQWNLAKNAQGAQREGRPSLTKEERLALQKALEELAKQLSSDKAMQEYLKRMMAAMSATNGLGRMAGLLPSLGSPIPIPGSGAPGNGMMLYDSGKVNHDKPQAGGGKTNVTAISGQIRQTADPQEYVEIKAPTTVGNRSSVPYVKVLPSYRKKAESALDRQEIPKQYQQRVKEYFEGLGH